MQTQNTATGGGKGAFVHLIPFPAPPPPLSATAANVVDLTLARRGCGELFTNNETYAGPENLDGSQHLLMGKRRNTHLERDAGDAAKGFIHIQYLFCHSLGVVDQQEPGDGTARDFHSSHEKFYQAMAGGRNSAKRSS